MQAILHCICKQHFCDVTIDYYVILTEISLTDEPLSIIVQYGFFICCNYTQGSKLLCKEKVSKHQKSKFFEKFMFLQGNLTRLISVAIRA